MEMFALCSPNIQSSFELSHKMVVVVGLVVGGGGVGGGGVGGE